MRFHLLDRIVAWHPGERAVGVKAITRSDGAYAVRPLVIEALAQLSSYLLGDAEERDGRRVMSLLVGVSQLRFHGEPRPGDRLLLDARIAARGPEGARVEVSATADDRPVADGRLSFAFFAPASADQLQDFAWTQDRLRQLRAGL